jgi:hypothetical protein
LVVTDEQDAAGKAVPWDRRGDESDIAPDGIFQGPAETENKAREKKNIEPHCAM